MRSRAMGGGGGGGGGGGERTRAPHRSGSSGGGGGSELFICFTARPSTSMRARTGRSLPSPGRNHREAAVPPLSASLSRRLRSSGSLKGGQSPVFPPRKGCAFRPAEPSSPKVTCIGQVRVKSKAKNKGEGAALRSRSRSDSLRKREEGKSGIGEEGRECSRNYRNQSWVYQLPTSICEALRAIGSEFSCFLPCGGGRSLCSSSSNAREERRGGGGGGREEKRSATSCGAVFVRWLMAIEESDNGEGGEMVGLVVGEREKGELDSVLREREKREVEVEEVGKGEVVEKKEEVLVVKEEVVCVPPKNALLLMRCRSDPVKVAALASRFFGSPATKVQAEEEEEDEDEGNGNEERKDDQKHLVAEEMRKEDGIESNDEVEVDAKAFSQETGERGERETQRSLEGVILSVRVEESEGALEDRESEEKEKEIVKEGFLYESHGLLSDPTEIVDAAQTKLQEKQQERDLKDETFSLKREEKEEEDMKRKESSIERNKEKEENAVKKEVEEIRSNTCSSECNKEAIRCISSCKKERRRHSFSTEREARRHSFSTEREARRASISVDKEGRMSWSFFIEKKEIKVESEELPAEAEGENKKEPLTEEEEISEGAEVEKLKPAGEAQVVTEGRREDEEESGEEEEEEEEEESEELPDCLLLMMYEPKLSMEVSRETWICSNDFLHGHRHHHDHSSKQGGNRTSKQKVGVDRAGDGTCVKVARAGDGMCVGGQEVIQSIESSTQHPPPLAPVPPLPSAVEQKLLSGAAASLVPEYEGFVLTRCKSEPMSSSARLAADAGFWKNRHRPIGTIGF